MVRPRYIFAEAWSIARSSPRQTLAAITLVALALYVPGLLALLARNLGRLAASDAGDPPAVTVTLLPDADRRALAERVAKDPRVRLVRIVGSEAALDRFRRAYPDLGAALAELREAPFPPSLEISLRASAPRGTAQEIAGATRLWPGVESVEATEEFSRRFRDAVGLVRNNSTAQFANCGDWRRGTPEQRYKTIEDIRGQLTPQRSETAASDLSDDAAYAVFQHACKADFTDKLRLYKLYARAQAFAVLSEAR